MYRILSGQRLSFYVHKISTQQNSHIFVSYMHCDSYELTNYSLA